jgi:hypothetical protein
MASFYTMHFTTYKTCKKQVAHLIPNVVWKNVYVDYHKGYAYSMFMEETLKDCLCNTLKELKTRNFNEKGLDITTLNMIIC